MTLRNPSCALLALKQEELLSKFNPMNKSYALSLGDKVHEPNRTPQLIEVRDVYGDNIADAFLRIQIENNFRNLGVLVNDVAYATANVALSIRQYGQRLMLAEWLLVFHEMDNCEDIRKDFNQANYVRCLKEKITLVQNKSSKVQESIERAYKEKRRAELYTQYKNGQISFDEYFNQYEEILLDKK